ncbi:hypothetical protein HanIR_Chr04g0153381 [Helianthus annuus]|nr:hypothetical protein HanIR_Chr04g0153381 [Helianthus annuus]
MKSVHLTTSLIVPTLCFPKYRCGFTAIIFSFSGSLIAFTGPLPSGITAHESASPNNSPYMVICSLNKQQKKLIIYLLKLNVNKKNLITTY